MSLREEIKAYECTYRETGCGSCENQLNCPNDEIYGDMQNDEAIKILKDIIDYSDGGIFPKDIEAINLAIKALEQEPKTDVLDKIRAEIEEQKKCRCFDDSDMFVYRTGLNDAINIIDKYMEESEKNVCKGCYYNDGEVHAECVICDKVESEG